AAMKKILLAVSLFAIVTACNNSGKENKEKTDSTTNESVTNKMDNAVVSETTRTFMTTVANSGMAEVQIASMAQEKAKNSSVKDFAAMLYQAHSAVNDQVKSIATQKNIALTDTIYADKQKI